jgi:uncharacterized membrane protein YdjX (TVP38/TMEM64 family)
MDLKDQLNKYKKLLIFAVVLVVFSLIYKYTGLGGMNWDTIMSKKNELIEYYQKYPVGFSVGYFLTYVFCAAFSIPIATVLSLMAGVIFGITKGTILISFSSTMGATLAFLLCRFFIHDWVQERFGDKIKIINDGIKKDGHLYLLAIRLNPIFPFFVVNLGMGLTPISTRVYYFISQLGMLPGTFIFVNAGTQISQVSSPKDIIQPATALSLALLGLFPLLMRFVISRFQKKKS